MKKGITLIAIIILPIFLIAQDLTEGLIINDLSAHPMQEVAKPGYLNTIVDPSFGTTIRRITDSPLGGVIVPMYSTVQAWNADESLMILYNQSMGRHVLMDGMTYQLIRILDDISPADLEQVFWDFNDEDVFYYLDSQSKDFIQYSVSTQEKEILVNLFTISGCNGGVSMGNDIQMMSWDSDVFTFRCNNDFAYSYRISTNTLLDFEIDDVSYVAPGVGPSGNQYYHEATVYDNTGNKILDLNIGSTEHSCIGKLPNGNDAYYAIAFEEGPQGGCIGDIISHDLTTGECTSVISQSQGYDYPQSGTHISALAHKNTEGGWIAASMMGYDKDGQSLLDQELVIAKVEEGNIKVCRIGHHRSDEDQFDYWGEPHAVISPRGTRVLFGSDWSGTEDGQSVDSYVVELPAFSNTVAITEVDSKPIYYKVFPNPVEAYTIIEFDNPKNKLMNISVYNSSGKTVINDFAYDNSYKADTGKLNAGFYIFKIYDQDGNIITGKFIKN